LSLRVSVPAWWFDSDPGAAKVVHDAVHVLAGKKLPTLPTPATIDVDAPVRVFPLRAKVVSIKGAADQAEFHLPLQPDRGYLTFVQ
jgi:hypothetical protein